MKYSAMVMVMKIMITYSMEFLRKSGEQEMSRKQSVAFFVVIILMIGFVAPTGLAASQSITGAKLSTRTLNQGKTLTIQYKLAQKADVTISIAAMDGKLAASYIQRNVTAKKMKTINWSGKATVGNELGLQPEGYVSDGQYRITITSLNATKTLNLVFKTKPVKVSAVEISPNSLALEVGGQATLSAEVSPSNAADKRVTWSSRATKVAAVSSSGVVTAKAAGTTKIKVTTKDGKKTNSIEVTVTEPEEPEPTPAPTTPLEVTPLKHTEMKLVKGNSRQIAMVEYGAVVHWVSEDPRIATIDENGVVTAVSAGSTRIKTKEKKWEPLSQTANGSSTTTSYKVIDIGSCTVHVKPTEAEAYKIINGLRKKYKQGMRWTSANVYASVYPYTTNDGQSGNEMHVGEGCIGYALMVSDHVFNNSPIAIEHLVDVSQIKVGDILMFKGGWHYVMVLTKNKKGITVTEGSWGGGKVYWDRSISWAYIKKYCGAVLTRY